MTTRTTAAPRPRVGPRKVTRRDIANRFKQWLAVHAQIAILEERDKRLKSQILDGCEALGIEDEKGSAFLDLPEPIEWKDHDGRVFVYQTLKREKYLSPAVQLPQAAPTEELLRKKKLWLTKVQEKQLNEVALQNRFIRIKIEIDPDAVAQAYLNKLITEDEYNALLQPQVENFRFQKLETAL